MRLGAPTPAAWADRPAVLDGELHWSWAELEQESARVSGLLIANGVRAGDRVALLAGRSAASVAGLRGILRMGAAAVPLDPKEPALRQEGILRDASVSAVLVGRSAARRARPVARALSVPFLPLDAESEPTPAAAPEPSSPALLLYTSGSTGPPKAVVLSHTAVAHFAHWAAERLQLTPSDRIAHLSPLTFDLCTLELFASAAVGATVVVVPPGATVFPTSLAGLLSETACTVVYTVPSVWMRLLEADLSQLAAGPLRELVYAGEPFPPASLAALMERLPGRPVHNFFGPTETNVCAAHRLLEPPVEAVPIGRPPPHYAVWVQEDGELWVRGPGLMTGYWRRPGLDADTFVEAAGHRWLKTGDRVRVDAEGVLHALGRRDSMLKHKGFRVQPEEVEQALTSHAEVESARVGLCADGRLVAEVVAVEAPVDLRRHLSRRLPGHMIPQVVWVDQLPRTARGKVDRSAPFAG